MFSRFSLWFATGLMLFLPLASFAADLSSDEKAWLNLVDPIITSEERRIFRKKLRNSRKRAEFVDLFWAKRDPDLSDDYNPFRRDYLARYDYVMAHYDRGNKRPQSARGQIFLLLGKPDRVEMRVDFRLTGLDYRNQFIQFQPELWIFESPGYEFPRRELRIQFVPVSSFGEYTALTDQLSWHFIRNLKYKFIANRDLKKAPLKGSGGQSFQDDISQVSEGGGATGVSAAPAAPPSAPTTGITRAPVIQAPPPQAQPTPPTTASKESTPSKVDVPPVPEASQEMPEKAKQPAAESTALIKPETVVESPQTQATKPVIVEPDANLEKPEKQSNPAPKPEPTVPTKPPVIATEDTRPVLVPKPNITEPSPEQPLFSPTLGNASNLAANLAFFGRDPNQSLLLGRLGIPMSSLDFQFSGDQYRAEFVLVYELRDQHQRVYAQDRIVNTMAVPNLGTTKKDSVHYAREITMLVPPGRFTLQAQLETPSGKRLAYEKTVLDVQAFTASSLEVTPLVLLDPNIPNSQSQVQVGGKPFGLHLSAQLPRGERLYPLIEISGAIQESALNSIEFVVLENGEEVTRWGLYPEETTQTTQQTLWVHPILNTKSLEFGNYTLRFEMDRGDGQWITRDTPFTVE